MVVREPVDYYAILQVNPSATPQVIEAAYRTVLAQTPNDQTADPLVTEAYQVLSDHELRDSYDHWYTGWFASHPDQVRAEARRRARRETGRKVQVSLGRLGEQANQYLRSARETTGQSIRKASAASVKTRTAYRQRREARTARARELTPLRRKLALHPVLATLACLLVVAAVATAVLIPMRISAERAEQERILQAQAAAEAEAARIAQEDAEQAAAEATRKQAEDAEREAEEARQAEEREEAARERAAAREAEQQAAEEAKQQCAQALADGASDLSGCDLSGANLAGLDLNGRDLTGANVRRADLRGAILDGANLTDVRWLGATCPDGTTAGVGDDCTDFPVKAEDEAPPSAEPPSTSTSPLALGQTARIGDWTVTVTSYQADAQSNARAVGYINNEPGQGFIYAIVGLAVTYEGTGQSETPGGNLDFDINGTGYLSPDTLCSLPIDDSAGWVDRLNTGQSTSYQQCMYLPVETATTGTIRVYDGYSFDPGAQSAQWAIP